LRRPETTIGEAGENLKISRPKSHRNTKQTTGGSREKRIMKVGITFSAFDLLHDGLVKMLEDAKRECDYLICVLQEKVNSKDK
jgi:bifunctional ADP-heptose synthase (sugar kinase/adenylyltransferase)